MQVSGAQIAGRFENEYPEDAGRSYRQVELHFPFDMRHCATNIPSVSVS